MNARVTNKVNAEHLRRGAYLYVRQSTLHQVFNNTESTQRQYELRRRAVALGWPEDRIVIIDSDQGQSGASAADREGFQRLMAETATGRAGIVMGLEVSRLARNCSDWHRLLEICALTGTLILDEDGIYDPSDFNDQLLLGLKGTMSAAELHLLRARMHGGLMAKARRGELRIRLPVGFIYDASGRVQLDPDRQVRDAIVALLDTFRRTGTARRVVLLFREQGWRFPCRPPHGPRMGELVWQELTYNRALQVLHNPRYTGAYVLGRTRQRKLGSGRRTTSKLPREQWQVLLPGSHDGYISWEEFQENQRRLYGNNWKTREHGGTTPPREGSALLQGLAICGGCGKPMHVHYEQHERRRVPIYYCPRGSLRTPREGCQSLPGASIDAAVSGLAVEAMSPMALEAALTVHDELQARFEQADRLRREQVERARHEADAARRRYMRVDPDNRLVADTLEADWNVKLHAAAEQQQEYERWCQRDKSGLSPDRRDQIASLATDFPTLWNSTSTTDRDRKRMLRLLIEDVTLLKGPETVDVHVRFRGGATRSLSLPRPLPSWKNWMTPEDVLHEIDRLLDKHTNAEIARSFNDRGMLSGKGQRFTTRTIKAIRCRYALKSTFARLRERGMLTEEEVADCAQASLSTVRRWRREGRLRFHVYNDKQSCLYEPTGIPMNRRAGSVRSTDSNGHDRIEEMHYEA